MASSEEPFRLYFFWDCAIRYDGGSPYFEGRAQKTWLIRRRISHSELVGKVCNYRGIDMATVKVKFTVRYPILFRGCSSVQYTSVAIEDDDDMEILWTLPSEFRPGGVCVYVEFEDFDVHDIPSASQGGGNVNPGDVDIPNLNEAPASYPRQPGVGSFTSLLMETHGGYDLNDFSFPPPPPPPTTTYAPGYEMHQSIFNQSHSRIQNLSSHHMNDPLSSTSSNSYSTTIGTTVASEPFDSFRDFVDDTPSFPCEDAGNPVGVTTDIAGAEPSMVGGRAVLDSLGPTSDMDGGPNSNGEDELADDLDDGSEDEDGEDTNIPTDVHMTQTEQRSVPNFHSFECFINMGSGAPIDLHEEMNIHIDAWSENETELRVGMRFNDKAQAIFAVKM